jgi:DNA-binding transcriptional LysR family regulator
MNYTLHQLQIFEAIVETGSVTKAAEQLHLTQPAVSIQLKKFQEQFDAPLFENVGRNIFVTDFGKEIARAGQRILDQTNLIRQVNNSYKGLLSGKLTFSIVSTAKYVMPHFLSGFMRQHPGIELKMDVTNKSSVVRSLERNEVDFSLVSVVPENLKLKQIRLMKNKLFLIANRKALGIDHHIDVSTLATLPMLFREKGSATRQAMEKYLSHHNILPPKSIELTSNEAVKQSILAGLGCSLVPIIGIKNELKNGDLEIIKIKGLPIETHWCLIWIQQKQLSPVAEAFLAYLTENKDQVIKDVFAWYETY